MDGHAVYTVDALTAHVMDAGAGIAVITGGEPALHDLTPLAGALRKIGCRVHVETSGAHELVGEADWVTLSPKRFKPPVETIYPRVDELKIIVVNRHDFEWAEAHAVLCPPGARLLLQPEWNSPRMIPHIIAFVKQHPRWQISLQTHKYLNIP
jgi:7-carboxy-7-deazaguanine synthase